MSDKKRPSKSTSEKKRRSEFVAEQMRRFEQALLSGIEARAKLEQPERPRTVRDLTLVD